MKFPLTLGVSARHVHLCEADLLKLPGIGAYTAAAIASGVG